MLGLHFAILYEPKLSLSCRGNTDNETAPLQKDVKIKYDMVSFNGSFMAQTIYRQDASPEVDSAWEALGLDCTFSHKPLHSITHSP